MFGLFGGGKRSKPLVLHVDDDAAIRILFRDLLEEMGYDVINGSHGQEGVDSARKNSPDLIILDVQMPGLDGFGAALVLKQDPKTLHIPILMMTSLAQMRDVEKALSNGVDDYTVKPVDFAAFKTKVAKLLAKNSPPKPAS